MSALIAHQTKDQALARASESFSRALVRVLTSEPRAAAERAYLPGGPSIDEIESRIRLMQSRYRQEAAA